MGNAKPRRAELIALVIGAVLMMTANPAMAMGGDWEQSLGNGWRICGANGEDCIVTPRGSSRACVWDKLFDPGCAIFRRYVWVGNVLIVEAGARSLFHDVPSDTRRYYIYRGSDALQCHPIDRAALDGVLQELGVTAEPDWIATQSLWQLRERFAALLMYVTAALVGAGMLVVKWWRSLTKPAGATAAVQ